MNHRHEARYCECGEKVSECQCLDPNKPKRVTRKRCSVCVTNTLLQKGTD